MKKLWLAIAIVWVCCMFFAATSGGFLVIDAPQPSDAIVVLAGETDRRPQRSLELLSQHFAPRILLDVPAEAKVYGVSMLDLANEYIDRLPARNAVAICPITGLSTKTEAHDVARCLQRQGMHKILLVTSDYHTRRALSTLRHELPGYQFSIAAAYDSEQFGSRWWEHRQWAKLNIGEWFRLVWWQTVDRWR
jgi:DUF218 domain